MGDAFDPTDYGGPPEDPLGLEDVDGTDDPALATDKQLRDAILFVIDCNCLTPLKAGGRSVVAEALGAAVNVLKTKVITSPEDRIGVLFYGVREKQNPNNFEHIRVLQDLDRSSAQRIRQLEQEAARTPAQFDERYGHGKQVPLSDVFWCCSMLFNLRADKKIFQNRVFLFTSNDMPCKNAADQAAAETRAQDLMDAGVDVEFFPLIPDGGRFSIDAFWGRILPVDTGDYIGQAAVRVEELERRIRRRLHRKRTLQRIMLEVCPGVEVAVSVFVHVLEAKVPQPVYLLNESNKPLKSETRHICEQTGSILHAVDDIETYIDLAGQRVQISRAEIDEIKRLGDPGMRLVGVTAATNLKPHHRIFHSYFVCPNDGIITGSAALCSALIDCLSARKQIALVRYIPRRNSQPVLAALVPQVEVLTDGEVGDQVAPPGFHMILLPWGEEIRKLSFPAPEGMPVSVTPELASAARRVVQDMRLDGFTPGCVENPVLQKHYAAVQALALGEDNPEETVDMLQPDAAALAEKRPLLLDWKAAIDAAVPVGPAGAVGKRGFAADGDAFSANARPAKAPKLTVGAGASIEEMRELVLSGEVDRLTVSVLKDWLKGQGIVSSGKKGDLVERIRSVV